MTITFNTMYIFLYNRYFFRVAFELVYLLKKKIKAFIDTLELLGFKKSYGRLKPSAKYQKKTQ